MNTEFTVAQVTALCGGMLPYGNGFAWQRVHHFELEDGVLQPYSEEHGILPGPGIRMIDVEVVG
jgi:hypothetical protein